MLTPGTLVLLLASPVVQEACADGPAAMRELALPELALEDLGAWRARVRPTPEEAAWLDLPWIPEFAAGLEAADRAGKPLLFWAMNGHPLGCT